MKFKIDTWVGGVKRLTLNLKTYSISVFPSILSRYKSRKYFKPDYIKQIFSIKGLQRTTLTEWDYDITILGITFQFQKYKEFMLIGQ